ncbi:MAG: pilus assembly protein TadG-related protein [Acidimicrobiia bacterium]
MRDQERGAVTVFVTILTVALLAVCGLVTDGGRILAARREAGNVAESAARAGAQAIDLRALRQQNQITLDPSEAAARARDYLNATEYHGDVQADTQHVHVVVTIHRSTLLLGAAGVHDFTVSSSGDATPIRGITTQATP